MQAVKNSADFGRIRASVEVASTRAMLARWMTQAEALRLIRGYARARPVLLSVHAYEEMEAANATERDVREAIANAKTCVPAGKPGRRKVTGTDQKGDELTCVVVIEDGIRVVTVW
jgi:hypothetical protein